LSALVGIRGIDPGEAGMGEVDYGRISEVFAAEVGGGDFSVGKGTEE